MIRTGKDYRDSIRDGREVHMNGERIRDVVEGPDGAIYVATDADNGKIFRITPGS